MTWLAAPAAAAGTYYALALAGAWRWSRRVRAARPSAQAESSSLPGVSILKPVRGRDPHFYDAIRSQAEQDYPEFEILFGVGDPADPALQDIERLKREFPSLPVSVHVIATAFPNAKAGVLAGLARLARHPLLLISDSDIRVPAGYLKAVTAELAGEGTGLVTCLYRAAADSVAGRWEALGVSTEFMPSVLVARLLGVVEFALGSTMLLRCETLRQIGGFEAIANYLADDYQLGKHVSGTGQRIAFARVVVETHLGAPAWRDTWKHQVRWSRTIRVSRPAGYFGYVVTHATLWALAAYAAGHWIVGTAALGLRMAAGLWIGAAVLRDRNTARLFWLIPFRDLMGFAVWAAGLFGSKVEWRGKTLLLRRDGTLEEIKHSSREAG